MWMKQYYLGCLAHASYLIADEATGTAVVVDPQRDIEQYLHDATAHDFHIDYVFLTHFHADFLAGHIELRDRVGASCHLAFVLYRTGEPLGFASERDLKTVE